MTWARTITTGQSPGLRFRMSIERFGVDIVSHQDMATAAAGDGRARRPGLSLEGVKLTQRADLVKATVDASGATFKIADAGEYWTAAFNMDPSATTWLDADASSSTTTITVKSTALFPSSGRIWIDSEVISYSGKTATTFTGCTRGVWQSQAQAHYIPNGAMLRYPEVTSGPTLLEGARVRLYVYGRGDSPTGDGTQIWLGVMRSEPRMQGPVWSFLADPISTILDSDVGGDLGDPVTPRGITFNAGASSFWFLSLTDGTTEETITYPGSTHSGHFETAEEFYTQVNADIRTALASIGTTTQLAIEPWGSTYRFHFVTASPAEPLIATFRAPECEPQFPGDQQVWTGVDGPGGTPSFMSSLTAANADFYWYPRAVQMEGAGSVPRGVFGASDGVSPPEVAALTPDNPPGRLYLGGAVGLATTTTLVQIEWPDTDTATIAGVETLDSGDRFLDLRGTFRGQRHVFTAPALPEIRLGRDYTIDGRSAFGTYTLMRGLSDASPENVNTGSQPMVQVGDYDSVTWSTSIAGLPPYALNRRYRSLQAIAIKDLLCPDLQLAGQFLAFDSSGRLVPRRLRLATATETALFEVTKSNLLTDNDRPTYERGAAGLFNTVTIPTGYDPIEDDHTGRTIHVRDVAAHGRSPNTRAVKIESKSELVGLDMDEADAMIIATGILGIFGAPYAYITLQVSLTAFGVVLGDTVSVTTAALPSTSGTRGVESLRALVIGRELDLYAARITWTLLAAGVGRRVMGYAFSALLNSTSKPPVDLGGDQWEVTALAAYFATGDSAENHLEIDDDMVVFRWDNATAGAIGATVLGVAGNTITLQLHSTWTVGADEWVLSFGNADSSAVSLNQKRYAYVADATGNVGFDPGPHVPAGVFAP